MLKLELWKSDNDNIHLSFEDNIHGDDVEIKISPEDRVYVKGLSPSGKATIYNLLNSLLVRECNKIDVFGYKNKKAKIIGQE